MITILSLGFAVLLASSASVAAGKCPFVVEKIRESRAGETALDTDRNTAVGSNGLVAHVVVEKGRGRLVVNNVESGDSLFGCPYALLPAWSPDGKYLSVSMWTTETRMGKLVVFDASNWKRVIDLDLASAASATWSPDSKRIVSDGSSYADGEVLFYEVTVPAGAATIIDRTRVHGDIDFSWSPDSRWIVYSMPTKLHHVGDTMVSELRIADAASGEYCTLIPATDHNQSNPLWIDDHTIQIDRIWWDEDEDANWTNREERVVIDLKPSG